MDDQSTAQAVHAAGIRHRMVEAVALDWPWWDDEIGLAGPDVTERAIVALAQAGQSVNQITQELYGYTGGMAYYKVMDVLATSGIDLIAERDALEQARIEQALALWDGGVCSISAIAGEVMGSTAGGCWYKIKRILQDNGRLEV
jgi:hypothetical protein